MKILQVSSAMTLGGGEVHVTDLCRALAERGHEVHVALRPRSPLQDCLSPYPVIFHPLPLRNSLDVASAHALGQVIRVYQIDIVHGHVARDYLVCAAARRLVKQSQLVLTRHHYLPLKRNWGYRRLVRQVGRFIAVSEFVRQGLIVALNVSPERVVTIPNWVDPDAYHTLPDPQQARARFDVRERFVVGVVGQITPAKGQEEFVRAASIIAASREDVAFLVAGQEQDPSAPFTLHLRDLARQSGAERHLKFVGRVEDLPQLFSALTVLVVPSWHEAFSLVLIQAMAAGVPVVASAVGGPAEIVTDRVTGLLVPPRRVEALVEAIQILIESPDQRHQLAAAAATEVQTRFARNMIIDQIESVYQCLLDSQQPIM